MWIGSFDAGLRKSFSSNDWVVFLEICNVLPPLLIA